jgi:hypothetical protein
MAFPTKEDAIKWYGIKRGLQIWKMEKQYRKDQKRNRIRYHRPRSYYPYIGTVIKICFIVMVLIITSCSQGVTVQQAANGKVRCGQRLR